MRKKVLAWMFAIAAVLGVTSVARAAGTNLAQQSAFAGASGAWLGYSVAVDGTTAVVGAPNDGGGNGAVYIYVLAGSTWTQQQELVASDGAGGDQFGYAVAVSGNTALIGAVGKSNNQGYVYAFTRTGSAWTPQSEWTSSDGAPGDCFGCSIALRGTTALVGAPDKAMSTGGAYAFVASGSTWPQQQEFLGAATGAFFGFSVALTSDDKTAVVGAPGASSAKGQGYVFVSNGSAWSQQTVLTAGDGSAGDKFGYAVAVDGSTALVGAYAASGSKGAAYVYTTSAGTWSQQTKLQASDGKANDDFGYSVSLSGTRALVGAYEIAASGDPGAAYVFTNSSGSWSQQELSAPIPGQSFGSAVALSGTAAVIGAFGESNPGGAFMFGPAATPAAPALGSMGTMLLSLVLLGAASWSMARRTGPGPGSRARSGPASLFLTALCLIGGASGCSAGADSPSTSVATKPPPSLGRDPSSTTPPASTNQNTGSIGFELTLPGGENIAVVDWAIAGPSGAATVIRSGMVNVQATLAAKFLVDDIPAGSGYAVTLSATSTDDTITCSGAAPFSVTAHASTLVAVQMACAAVGTAGHGTSVSGSVFNCAAWSSVTANPTETKVGTSVAIAAVASGPDPSMLTYAWSSSTGTLSAPTGATSNFTCTQVGPAVLTLTVGDGPVPAGSSCNPGLATTTVTITCDPGSMTPPPPPPAPALPPWGCAMLAAGMLGIGLAFTRRASRFPEIG